MSVRALLLVAALGLASGQVAAPPASRPAPASIEGYYTVNGGESVCCISRAGDGYVLTWAGPNTSASGLGIRRADVLAVSCGQVVCCYLIVADDAGRPKLVGEWLGPPKLERHDEILTWLRGL
jgi:hypothetical protein